MPASHLRVVTQILGLLEGETGPQLGDSWNSGVGDLQKCEKLSTGRTFNLSQASSSLEEETDAVLAAPCNPFPSSSLFNQIKNCTDSTGINLKFVTFIGAKKQKAKEKPHSFSFVCSGQHPKLTPKCRSDLSWAIRGIESRSLQNITENHRETQMVQENSSQALQSEEVWDLRCWQMLLEEGWQELVRDMACVLPQHRVLPGK